MSLRETIAHLAADKDEEMLLLHIAERMTAAENRNVPAASNFLSGREQMLVSQILHGVQIRFFGGREGAERAVCCYLPEYLDDDWLCSEDGPVAAVRATFFEQDKLTHRDFLGSLMGCGIKRETVGDIYVSEGKCDFLVTREILPYVLQNLESAGRTKLHLEQIPLSELYAPQTKTKTVRDTVSSLRLDGVVSSGFSISRGKAADAIAAGKVEVNFTTCTKADKTVSEGDSISLRGLGKMRLTEVGGNTKKGRISIVIDRFL